MGDMPFMSYATVQQAIENAARLMQQGGAHMVKLEGSDTQIEIVSELSKRGIPVCAHLGLQPQAVHKIGGYKVQGRGGDAASAMMQQANELLAAGADLLLLECVPAGLAKSIADSVDIPVIGIGAGSDCDGQILVLQDAIGITSGYVPKFVRDFSDQSLHPETAIRKYVAAVRDGSFPAEDHCFY
jgi:3-methyl-2-oxobutanoate hydroxymethyltransferase